MHETNESPIDREAISKEIERFSQTLPVPEPGSFPRRAFRQCGEFGLLGLPVARELGGQGKTALELAAHMEALGYFCRDSGLLLSIAAHLSGCIMPIWRLGNEEQHQRLLPRLCSGEWLCAHAATEPEAGSDLFGLKSTLEEADGGFHLTGRKAYILNGSDADLFLVMATTEPGSGSKGLAAVLVERNTPGLRIGRSVSKSALRNVNLTELEFERCFVPSRNRLGGAGTGGWLFHVAMQWERTFSLSSQVGAMRRVLEQCVTHARRRVQFGSKIGKFQSVANRVADMKLRVETARHLLYQAASALDRGSRSQMEPCLSKLFISEAAVETYLDAVRIHGAAGFTDELEFAGDLRDSLGGVILAGTSDILRQVIASELGL